MTDQEQSGMGRAQRTEGRSVKRTTLAALAIPAAISLAACGGQNEPAPSGAGSTGGTAAALAGEVLIDGSSTVGPLSIAAGEAFKQVNPGVNVSVGQSGTGGGFKKFCAGQTDISERLASDQGRGEGAVRQGRHRVRRRSSSRTTR
jgi:ABC-type phosphate transport system substrate-binding protein